MLSTKKLPRRFVVLASKQSTRKFIMPLDLHTLKYVNALQGNEIQDISSLSFCYSDGDVLPNDIASTFVRIGKVPSTERWKKERILLPRMSNDAHSKCFIKLNDVVIKVSHSFFQILTSTFGLKYTSVGTSRYDSDNERTIFINDAMIPENLTESMVQVGKLVDKNNESELYGTETLLSYHYNNWHPKVAETFMKYMDKNIGAVNFGFEAEKMDNNFNTIHNAIKLACETGFKKERDGSLGDGGFELISPVLPLFNDAVINEVISPIRAVLNSDTTDRCGGHFNVSMNGTTARELIKKVKGSLPIFYSIYSKRLDNSYCRAYQFGTYLRSPKKYQAFYVKNDSILEFRIFPAIKNEQMLKNRIQLMRIIFSELYGKSNNKVLLSMATKNSNLYNFMLNVVCGGSMDKFKVKLTEFAKRSAQYKCGIVTDNTKKKVNTLIGCDVFVFTTPIESVVSGESTITSTPTINLTASTPTDVSNQIGLMGYCDDVNDMYENAQAVGNIFLNGEELNIDEVDILPTRINEDLTTIGYGARLTTDMPIERIANAMHREASINADYPFEVSSGIDVCSSDIEHNTMDDISHVTNTTFSFSDYSLLVRKKYMRIFLLNAVAMMYKQFIGKYSVHFEIGGRQHYMRMSKYISSSNIPHICGVFAKLNDGRKYHISLNLITGVFNITHS
jgi:hypothetical protein